MKISIALIFLVLFLATSIQGLDGPLKQTLKKHNKYRTKHGVEKLTWDEEVAEFAQTWCDNLAANDKFEHSKGSGYGENLYKMWGSGDDPAAGAGKKAAIKWYKEIKEYDWEKPGFTMATGHFTQVVWKSSTKLGCGISTKESSAWVCCNYSPPGNYQNQFEENVPKKVKKDKKKKADSLEEGDLEEGEEEGDE